MERLKRFYGNKLWIHVKFKGTSIIQSKRASFGLSCILNKCNSNGETLLHIAAWHGQFKSTCILALSGADISRLDDTNWSPLRCAALEGYPEVVQVLVVCGANINERNQCKRTILHRVCDFNRFDMVQMLMKCGIDAEIRDEYGITALDLATSQEIKDFLSK